ncbi:MAG: IPT/TIG domain-containing protein [Candidatus Dormibacteria bacterium]
MFQTSVPAQPRIGIRVRKFSTVGIAGLALGSAAMTLSGSTPVYASTQVKTFTYTGSEQSWVVPAGVVDIDVAAVGGLGGASCGGGTCSYGLAPGGHGASVIATIPVTPGQTLYIEVGGNGNAGGTFNGGGSAGDFGGSFLGGNGGGATDLRSVAMASSGTLASRLLVAGGGGGAGGTYGTGVASAGGDAGVAAADATVVCVAGGGGGGTPGSGGAGGVASGSGDGENLSGLAGTLGDGGSAFSTGTGGGGGGGYYGGGSGSGCQQAGFGPYNGSGGGGGSSFVESSATGSSVGSDTTGNPTMVLSWTSLVPTVSSVSPDSGVTTGGTKVTITGTNFTGATAVRFNSTPAASFIVDSDKKITAVTPDPAAGTVNVTVTTPFGTSAISAADHFTFTVAASSIPVPTTGASPTQTPLVLLAGLMLLGIGSLALSIGKRRSITRG